jgi:phospholipid/cholesterol/gamma-HCH transport system substrate-binding protein
MLKRAMLRLEGASTVRIGAVLVTLLVVVGLGLFQKNRISTVFSSGEKVQADFSRDYRLRAYVTKVKIAGVRVGVVTAVEHDVDGATRVTMKVDKGSSVKLRSTPSAAIRPTTLLGGNYYVDLKPGGDPKKFTGVIPATRSTTPVELDRVLEALKPSARESLQRTIPRLDTTLGKKGQREVQELLSSAPDTFKPATPVLQALRGNRPKTDLSVLVKDLGQAARGLTRSHGELEQAIEGLHSTAEVLDRNKRPLADAISSMPDTLRNARSGLKALSSTLDEVDATAEKARPVARELSGLLTRLEPALIAARPLVHDLRPALRDIRPVVSGLVPSAKLATGILDDVDGGTLERLNGPIMTTLRSPFTGTGVYAGGGNSTPLYKELGNLIAGMNNAGRMTDKNGSTIHFQPGFGIGSVSGTPISFEQLIKALLYPGGS